MSSRSAPNEFVERNLQRARYLHDGREAWIQRAARLDHRDEGRGESRPPREFTTTEPLGDPQLADATAEPDHAQLIMRAQSFMQELSSTLEFVGTVGTEERFAEQLKKMRLARGLTHEQLSAALRAAGYKKKLHRNTFTNLENGKTRPQFAIVLALARFFEVSLDEMVFGISPASLNREVLEKLEKIQQQLDRPAKSTIRPTTLCLPPKKG